MLALQDVKQSGLAPALQVDPVDNIAVRAIPAYSLTQQLANPGIIISINGHKQLAQLELE
jgi:hypothetical protein